MNKVGKIIVADGVNVWPHELASAKVLASQGHVVEFIRPLDRKGEHRADCKVDGIIWEIKSPRASNLKAVERNLKRAKWQSSLVIFDSRRMKYVPDKAIERELRAQLTKIKEITHIKLINRQKQIIDIP